MDYKSLYLSFLENKELKKIMPISKGVWEQDEKEFIAIYKELETDINEVDLISIEDDEEDY